MANKKTTAFANERITFRLASLEQQAIDANDQIFVDLIGLKIRELRVLRLIGDNPGTTFVDIAAVTAIERSQTSRIIQTLIGKNLIRRKNSKHDARRFELFITKTGESVRAKGREISDRIEEMFLEQLTRAELKSLNTTLEKLLNWVRSSEYLEKLSEYRKK